MPKSTTKSELIVYKGIKFRRYPKALDWSSRNYYRPNASYVKRGIRSLHVEIWKDAHGPIPEGFDIHHKDFNPLNNAIENLECLSKEEHQKRHELHEESPRRKFLREQVMPKAQEAAKIWHASEEGRAWHSVIGASAWEVAEYKTYACEQCGKEFQSRALQHDYARFCSNGCKSAWRRAQGSDNVTAICERCGKEFSHNKYSKRQFCSRRCSNRARVGL